MQIAGLLVPPLMMVVLAVSIWRLVRTPYPATMRRKAKITAAIWGVVLLLIGLFYLTVIAQWITAIWYPELQP